MYLAPYGHYCIPPKDGDGGSIACPTRQRQPRSRRKMRVCGKVDGSIGILIVYGVSMEYGSVEGKVYIIVWCASAAHIFDVRTARKK